MSGWSWTSGRGGFGRRALRTAMAALVACTVAVSAASPKELGPRQAAGSVGTRAATPASDGVELELTQTGGPCEVHGSFDAPVAPGIVWSVLTDYEGIGRFVSAVRASRMERQPDGRILLRQDAVGNVFLFHKQMQVLLALDETPCTRIAFRDVGAKDFRSYAGEWRVRDDSTATHVEYQLTAEPRGAFARALCRGALRKSARDLLAQVRAEVIRRAPVDATEP